MSNESFKHHLTLNPDNNKPPIRNSTTDHSHPQHLPLAKETKVKPTGATDADNASLYFVGTATTILEWKESV
jgi:hypothetical protein